MTAPSGSLFPGGPPAGDAASRRELLEQYRLFVETSERVVARRQTANTFFLSINSLLLVAVGILLREATGAVVVAFGVAGLCLAGLFVCFAWRRMVASFRQLNTAKFAIIHLLEERLPAAMFKAEWGELGNGSDPARYRPFTGTEEWMPVVFMGLYALALVGGSALAVDGIR